ncbi:hypothetical protein BLNAU_5930 [Blattamonas nauphoetae]|uniref:Uncharacterized protein n=1 Tax=Blattamonas nauphoetae TaxID=2049346 RepID=A0ABQ9Y602_9EUKA|nr:hypothetical protein BLNAU_5930 [Blattamonas nauphoetae]
MLFCLFYVIFFFPNTSKYAKKQKMASFSGILPLFYIEAFSPIPEPRQSSEVHLHDYYRDICFLLTRQSFVSDLLKSIPESLLAPCSLPAPVHPAQLNRMYISLPSLSDA